MEPTVYMALDGAASDLRAVLQQRPEHLRSHAQERMFSEIKRLSHLYINAPQCPSTTVHHPHHLVVPLAAAGSHHIFDQQPTQSRLLASSCAGSRWGPGRGGRRRVEGDGRGVARATLEQLQRDQVGEKHEGENGSIKRFGVVWCGLVWCDVA